MHYCANAVTGEDGEGQAVLLRALAPLAGLAQMRERRPTVRRDRDLTSGPARLCQALGIDRTADGTDLVRGWVRIVDDGIPPPDDPGNSVRIGITRAVDRPWRWFVRGDPNVSR
jgi:DNA-3-methyladenine glycosylase